jgi:hypothetical protein
MPERIIVDLFNAYLQNRNVTANNPDGLDSILCPLCLTEIPRKDVVERVVQLEHIIPQHSTGETEHIRVGVKNVRSGLTIICTICNGSKGKELDFSLRNQIVPGPHTSDEYTFPQALPFSSTDISLDLRYSATNTFLRWSSARCENNSASQKSE